MVITLDNRLVPKAKELAPGYLATTTQQVNWIVDAYGKLRNEKLVRMILAEAASQVTDDSATRTAFVQAVHEAMIRYEIIPQA